MKNKKLIVITGVFTWIIDPKEDGKDTSYYLGEKQEERVRDAYYWLEKDIQNSCCFYSPSLIELQKVEEITEDE